MNNHKIFTIFLGVCCLIGLWIYWFLPPTDTTIVAQYVTILFSLFLCVGTGLFSLYQYGFKAQKSFVLILLTGGALFWLVGELLWTYYEYIIHVSPFPSIADLFYLLAYPLLTTAIIIELKQSQINWKLISASLRFQIFFSSVLLFILVSYFGGYLAYLPERTMLANTIAISYALADVVLIIGAMLVLILAWEFRGGSRAKTWMILFSSFLLVLIADILFAIFTNYYESRIGVYRSLIDSLWFVSYILLAYGLATVGLSIITASERLKSLKKTHTR